MSPRGTTFHRHTGLEKKCILDSIPGANHRLLISMYSCVGKCNSMALNIATTATNREQAHHTSQYALPYFAMRHQSLVLITINRSLIVIPTPSNQIMETLESSKAQESSRNGCVRWHDYCQQLMPSSLLAAGI